MNRHTRDESLVMVAEVMALRGTCSRRQVGVVFAKEGRILMTGYNGAPKGLDHCYHLDDSPCEVAVHAEANAIAYAARTGVALEGAQAYCTDQPCLKCAQLLINAGISELYWVHPYRVTDGIELLRTAGIRIHQHPPMTRLEDQEQDGISAFDWDASV